MRNISDKSLRENQNTHILFSNFFFRNRTLYEIVRKNVVEPDRQQITVWCMRIACCITKARNTHLKYVRLSSFPLQQWFTNALPHYVTRTLPLFVCYSSESILPPAFPTFLDSFSLL